MNVLQQEMASMTAESSAENNQSSEKCDKTIDETAAKLCETAAENRTHSRGRTMENIRKELEAESATENVERSFYGYRLMQMSPEDAREAAQIEADIFSMPWSENSFRKSLQSKDTCYLCWRDENEMVGYCGFLQSFDEADITNVAVRSDHRGRGLGRKMLEELMKCGNQRGVSRFTLEVRKSNETALSLYQSLGFESAGIRKNFYEKPKEDAVIMWKVDNC